MRYYFSPKIGKNQKRQMKFIVVRVWGKMRDSPTLSDGKLSRNVKCRTSEEKKKNTFT